MQLRELSIYYVTRAELKAQSQSWRAGITGVYRHITVLES